MGKAPEPLSVIAGEIQRRCGYMRVPTYELAKAVDLVLRLEDGDAMHDEAGDRVIDKAVDEVVKTLPQVSYLLGRSISRSRSPKHKRRGPQAR